MRHAALSLNLKTKKPRRLSRKHLQAVDEALWAAYHRCDRSAVMEKLIERFLGSRKRTIA
jgi:hypothetical protein